jgi:hypothetical protein
LECGQGIDDVGPDREDVEVVPLRSELCEALHTRQLQAVEQLLDDPEGQPGLEFLAGRPQHRQVRDVCQEALQERRLADARHALDEDSAWMPHACLFEPFV